MSNKTKKIDEKKTKKDPKKEARKLKIVSAKDARKHRHAAKNAARKANEAAQKEARKAKEAAENEARKAKEAAENEAQKAKAAAKKEARKAKFVAQNAANKAKQDHKTHVRHVRKTKAKAGRASKKERVIHTRVSQSLERELRESAAQLGVSVSNLVRNALLNTFGLVEGLVVDGTKVAHSARGETLPEVPAVVAAPAVATAPAVVIGWQAIVLNMNALCARCNAILPKGKEAFVGVLQGNGTKPIRCAQCVKAG